MAAKYEKKKWPDDYWPTDPAPPSAKAWDKSVAAFKKDRAAFRRMIADPDVDLLAAVPHGKHSYLREVLLAADHNAYHLGQLIYTRRVLGVEGLTMRRSLRALMQNIIDYAGLFPPAQLPLDEAIRNYARYRHEPESWMLGWFICPAARLVELSPYMDELFHDESPLAVSALGRGGPDAAGFRDGLRQDVNDIGDFRLRHGGRVAVQVIETRLPADIPRRTDGTPGRRKPHVRSRRAAGCETLLRSLVERRLVALADLHRARPQGPARGIGRSPGSSSAAAASRRVPFPRRCK